MSAAPQHFLLNVGHQHRPCVPIPADLCAQFHLAGATETSPARAADPLQHNALNCPGSKRELI
jgi:hypothetical protein